MSTPLAEGSPKSEGLDSAAKHAHEGSPEIEELDSAAVLAQGFGMSEEQVMRINRLLSNDNEHEGALADTTKDGTTRQSKSAPYFRDVVEDTPEIAVHGSFTDIRDHAIGKNREGKPPAVETESTSKGNPFSSVLASVKGLATAIKSKRKAKKNSREDTNATSNEPSNIPADYTDLIKRLNETKSHESVTLSNLQNPEKANSANLLNEAYNKITETDDPLREKVNQSSVGELLKTAYFDYARAMADVETKGGDSSKKAFWHAGERKRAVALQEAEETLLNYQLKYANVLVAHRESAGAYNEVAKEDQAQAKSNDLFDELRKLNERSRRVTLAERERRIDDRNLLHKGIVAVGKFFNKGKRLIDRNLVAGFLTAFGVTVSGAGWPITTGIALGAGSALRYGSKEAALDESIKNYSMNMISDKEFAKQRAALEGTGEYNSDEIFSRMAQAEFRLTRMDADKKLSAARKRANKNAKKLIIGYAAGGIAGSLTHGLLSSHNAVATAQPDNVQSSQSSNVGDAAKRVGDINPGQNHPLLTEVNYDTYQHPWNWAVEQFGSHDAMAQLHSLGNQAAQHGYNVQWHTTASGAEWISINGDSSTQGVLKVLGQYI